ncbi:MAG: arginine--tRNA ligase [Lachnospiraceae bacterium]|jgi:arginyl-tRNA synthetase|nr:arginine--tRNA ligase [Lachnospiraceae bacterium]
MKSLIELLEIEVKKAFVAAGYDEKYGMVTYSNRADLSEFQCNGALAGAKIYHKSPLIIAKEVCEILQRCPYFEEVNAFAPGFINMNVSPAYAAEYLNEMSNDSRLGCEKNSNSRKVILDFGGPNVAKPLHVGHLRSAIIGESLKRILKFMGDNVLGDIHMGDWGLQIGLIITELKHREPQSVYFDSDFNGEYPNKAPFTISDLEEIYPTASALSKENEEYRNEALYATKELQNGRRGYIALWKQIMAASVADLKKNYEKLNVTFDLWKGEADADPYIAPMIEKMKADNVAHIDDGALIIDVSEPEDTKEVPPCMILKSDGASLYTTTDLATLQERMEDYAPDLVLYVVDKRQDLHFLQVFRASRKARIVPEKTELTFLGFGTMNGKDAKPFKTREGGTMRLQDLLTDVRIKMEEKIAENATITGDEARNVAAKVALSAIKYGDLSNQAAKDYIFDVDRFTSFEGNTGPYILYTIVRINSILNKYKENCAQQSSDIIGTYKILPAGTQGEKALMLEASKFSETINFAYEELAPHKICAYIFNLANLANRFYHDTKILTESDSEKQKSYIALLSLIVRVLEQCIDLLGFEAPERM